MVIGFSTRGGSTTGGRDVHDLQIIPGEAEVVRIVFDRVQHREPCSVQSAYRAERIDKEVLRQLKNHVETHPALQKLYDKAMETEFSLRKMILCQWIERGDRYGKQGGNG